MAWAGNTIRRETTVDSTNRMARQWAKDGAPHGAVIIAEKQTAGRGRRGQVWDSSPSAGLWLSMVVRPASLPDSKWPLLPLATALAAADACRLVTGENVMVKWPNDLVLHGRKLAGILVEREGDAAIIGIGINVRHRTVDFPHDLRDKAISLEIMTGVPVSMPHLEHTLITELERRVDHIDFLDEYAARCVTIGARVRVLTASEEMFTGFAEGIDDMGALLVRDDAGALRRVLAGDVSVRGMMGYV